MAGFFLDITSGKYYNMYVSIFKTLSQPFVYVFTGDLMP